MTKPDISLQAAVMSFDEAMENWAATNPVYQQCFEALLQRFPIATQEVKQLYLLVTDAIYINDGLLFDYCLCKAIHQFQVLGRKGEIAAYDGFIKTLMDTADSALYRYIIRDPHGENWSIGHGGNFRDWLDEEPRRALLLERWELEVFENK
ncbi:MAG: hypothetical protein HAW66_07280 [Shewanella sp.]|nr:hypothetical protein [Shewanella sp.]